MAKRETTGSSSTYTAEQDMSPEDQMAAMEQLPEAPKSEDSPKAATAKLPAASENNMTRMYEKLRLGEISVIEIMGSTPEGMIRICIPQFDPYQVRGLPGASVILYSLTWTLDRNGDLITDTNPHYAKALTDAGHARYYDPESRAAPKPADEVERVRRRGTVLTV
jgi:hypothetical protein